jgi:hypothetical protein
MKAHGLDMIDATIEGDSVATSNEVIEKVGEVKEKFLIFPITDQSTAPTVGNGIIGFAVPASLDGWNLSGVLGAVYTSGSGTVTIQVRRRRSGSNVDMLSTRLTITNAYSSTSCVINTSNDDLSTGDMIYIDIDGATATQPTGLTVTLTINKEIV